MKNNTRLNELILECPFNDPINECIFDSYRKMSLIELIESSQNLNSDKLSDLLTQPNDCFKKRNPGMSETRLITLPERFDFNNHQAFNAQCEAVLKDAAAKRVVLDFTRVNYIDSSALGMLVLLHRKASPAGKTLAIRGARGTAKEVLDIANMQKLYESE